MLRFMPPETKGALLYHLTETFWLSRSGMFWISREELQEDAMLKILSLIQTQREFQEVCEHMTEDGSKSVGDAHPTRLDTIDLKPCSISVNTFASFSSRSNGEPKRCKSNWMSSRRAKTSVCH